MYDDGTAGDDHNETRDGGRSRPGARDASLDEVYDLLASARRRALISYLARYPGTSIPLDELVDVVTEGEPPDPGPVSHRRRVETDLFHVQLPKLDDAGVVSFDPAAETVRPEGGERLEVLLEVSHAVADERGDPSS